MIEKTLKRQIKEAIRQLGNESGGAFDNFEIDSVENSEDGKFNVNLKFEEYVSENDAMKGSRTDLANTIKEIPGSSKYCFFNNFVFVYTKSFNYKLVINLFDN